MTAVELYKFIKNNNLEWHYEKNDGVDDVILFPYYFQIDDFKKVLSPGIFDEGITCWMKDGYFVFWMRDICEYYGINLEEVFIKEEER